MANEFLADGLIQSVRDAGLLPASDEISTDTAIRAQLNFEQRLYLPALVQKAREDYLTDSVVVQTVNGVTRYRLPSGATAAAVRRVAKITAAGDAAMYPLSQDRFQAQGAGTAFGTGDYYFDANSFVIVQTPTGVDSYRIIFNRRLNKIVQQDSCGEISSINTGLKQVTLVAPSDGAATIPSTFTTTATYDFIRGQPHFDVLDRSKVVTTVASNVLTFTDTLPSELAVGDFVALAGQTPIANVPLELQDLLVLKACMSYLAARGDANKASLVKERFLAAEADTLTLISPRAKDSPNFIINYYGPGWNRMRWRWRRVQ